MERGERNSKKKKKKKARRSEKSRHTGVFFLLFNFNDRMIFVETDSSKRHPGKFRVIPHINPGPNQEIMSLKAGLFPPCPLC